MLTLRCFLFLVVLKIAAPAGILYPRESETREIHSLNGIWNFASTNSSDDNLPVKLMPVPSSYNDITADWTLRDHTGPVWYDREFYVPAPWDQGRVWIRFSSVCYSAEVWINGQLVTSHQIGHLPFQAEVTDFLNYGAANSISVVVDNTLTATSVPQGTVTELDNGRKKQTYTFDFFNYAGIDRSVTLYTTPITYIDDVTISTTIDGTSGIVDYQVEIVGGDTVTVQINLLDDNEDLVATNVGSEGSLSVANANLWWPYLTDSNPGYLYTLQVELLDGSGAVVDKYEQPIGIRTVTWTSTSLLINNREVYLRGFGRHEDSDIRGKGFDLPLIIRDYNLIKWIGANAYRTSHYPYAEEIMDLADELGIMIIDESPAVNTENYSDDLLENHKKSLSELIQRDKNRPSVIMWSAANEPRTQYEESEDYYRQVIEHVKSLDQSRPVTVVNNQVASADHSAQFIDIASFNWYNGWYHNTGDLDIIAPELLRETRAWHEQHNIPVLITEYGGDTQEGYHMLPTYIWSEEYQSLLLSRHFESFDQLRSEGFFIGEMIWNFADFKTEQSVHRVGGNKKGIFTRNRQPKAAAHFLRKRYWALAENLDGAELPSDLYDYVFSDTKIKEEL